MTAAGAARGALPGAAAARAVRDHESLDGVRRRPLPAAGPQGRGLPPGAHARGGLHADREGPVLLLQGPAALDLPDPGQVPRRGAPSRRPPPRPRVHDEGRLLVRRTPTTASTRATRRSATPTSASSTRLGLEYVIVKADAGAMGGSKSEEFLHPSPVGEDTFVRSAGGYAANVEAYTTTAPEPIPFDGLPAPLVLDSPNTPTIATLVDLANAEYPRPDGRAVDGRRHAEERRARAHAPRRHARARRDRPARRPRRSSRSASRWRSHRPTSRPPPRPTSRSTRAS